MKENVASQGVVVVSLLLFNIKSKAMNTNQNDPGCCESDSGCCSIIDGLLLKQYAIRVADGIPS
jgi:hypothetical protein